MVFIQAGEHYRAMTEKDKSHLISNMTESLMFVDEDQQQKIIEFLKKVDDEFGESVGRGL